MNQELLDALINYINKRSSYAALSNQQPANIRLVQKLGDDLVTALAQIEEIQKRVSQ